MSRARRALDEGGPVLLAVGTAAVVWLAVAAIRPSILPSPLSVWRALREGIADGTIPDATIKTLIRLVFSFVAAILVGTVIGMGLAASDYARRGFGKLVVALQVTPSPAWIPLALVWFGATERAVVFVTFVGAFPSVTLATMASLRQVPPLFHQAGRTLGARGWTLYGSIIFPAALPGYVAGLQQAWGFAWRALMAGEIIVPAARAVGLGHLLARSGSHLAFLLAVLAVIMVIGVAVDLFVFGSIDRRIRRRRGLAVA